MYYISVGKPVPDAQGVPQIVNDPNHHASVRDLEAAYLTMAFFVGNAAESKTHCVVVLAEQPYDFSEESTVQPIRYVEVIGGTFITA